MDINELAKQFTEMVVPFLTAGATAAASEMGKQSVIALWEKIKPRVEAKEAAQEAVQDVIKNPEDKTALVSLEHQIRKILEKDPDLAVEVGQIIQAGDDNVIIGGDVSGERIAVGKHIQQAETINIFYETGSSDSEKGKRKKAFETYLKNLQKNCYILPLLALGDDRNVKDNILLKDVYIKLDTTSDKDNPEKPGAEDDKARNWRGSEKVPVSVLEAVTTEKKVVLVGNAGSGKSSFAKNLLGLQCDVFLKNKENPGFAPDLIPVYLELRKLKTKLDVLDLERLSGSEERLKLCSAVLEQIRDDVSLQKNTEFLPQMEEAFEEGKILLVLDGLDEVPRKLREPIYKTVRAAVEWWKIEHIIITSRPNVYTDENAFSGIKKFEIAELDKQKISTFARAWYEEQKLIKNLTDKDVEERSGDLARRAVRQELIDLSRNPMMLTSMAIIHTDGAELPTEKTRLYDRLVNILSNKWQKEKTGNAEVSNELNLFLKDEQRLRKALEHLAYETHCANYELSEEDGKDSRAADLPFDRALGLLQDSKHLGDRQLAFEFLEYIQQRSGLFSSRGGSQTAYNFAHRSIQEYLAGCYMIKERGHTQRYWQHAAEGDFWSAPALLGAEDIIYAPSNSPKDRVFDLIYDLCPPKAPRKSEQAERALLWSGQIAAQIRREDIENDSGKDYLKRLISRTVKLLETGKHLAPRERAEAGNTLAKLGDLRPGVFPLFLGEGSGERCDFLFCEIPAGKFLMGSKKGDKDSRDNEYPQFEYTIAHNYFMTRYPITNAQFDLFVKDENGYRKDDWWTEAGLEWRKDRTEPDKFGGVFDLPNHPVVYVSWYEVFAFTRWATKNVERLTLNVWKNGKIEPLHLENGKFEIRLPSEPEWEHAARGLKEDQPYPWGDIIALNRANYSDTQIGATSAVGIFPDGMNDYGLLDMSGNVWEWCATEWQGSYAEYLEKENNDPKGDVARVVRGGSYSSEGSYLRCAFRLNRNPYYRRDGIGFRVVVSSFPISLLRSGS